jgi:Domain of unknown function (DUF5009)
VGIREYALFPHPTPLQNGSSSVINQNMTLIPTQKRAYALDALRGFAILTMVLSGTIAYKILPAWMYHAQLPPPDHKFNPNLPGLTWVDLVFPLFLFSMGAAIPLALSSRLAKGWGKRKIVLSILQRGFLLAAFAIILQHFRPQVINPNQSGSEKWHIALMGFFLLFFMFVRLPASWKYQLRNTITLAAWIAAIILLASLRYPDGSGFSLSRSDIILIVFANMAVFGSIFWLLTQHNLFLRLGLLVLLFSVQWLSTANSAIASVLSASPIPWLYRFEYLKYLYLVIPGTIAGDLIFSWMQNTAEDEEKGGWKLNRFLSITGLMVAIALILLIGLQARWVGETSLAIAVICSVGYFLFQHPTNSTEKLLNQLYRWGVIWLALGLILESYQGPLLSIFCKINQGCNSSSITVKIP